MNSPTLKVRPSALWYLLCLVIPIVGVGLAISAGIREYQTIADSFTRLGADGTETVELQQGMEETIWALWADNRQVDVAHRPQATIVVKDPAGAPVRVRPSTGDITFNTESLSGIDLGSFTAQRAGPYTVTVTFAERDGEVLAGVGSFSIGDSLKRVVKPVVLSIAGAIALWIVLMIARGRSKSRIARLRSGNAIDADPPTGPEGPIQFS